MYLSIKIQCNCKNCMSGWSKNFMTLSLILKIMVWNYQNYSYFKSRIWFSLYYIWQHAGLKLRKCLRSAGEGMIIFFQTPLKERVVSCVMEEGGKWICVIYKLCSLCVTGIGLASMRWEYQHSAVFWVGSRVWTGGDSGEWVVTSLRLGSQYQF